MLEKHEHDALVEVCGEPCLVSQLKQQETIRASSITYFKLNVRKSSKGSGFLMLYVHFLSKKMCLTVYLETSQAGKTLRRWSIHSLEPI